MLDRVQTCSKRGLEVVSHSQEYGPSIRKLQVQILSPKPVNVVLYEELAFVGLGEEEVVLEEVGRSNADLVQLVGVKMYHVWRVLFPHGVVKCVQFL